MSHLLRSKSLAACGDFWDDRPVDVLSALRDKSDHMRPTLILVLLCVSANTDRPLFSQNRTTPRAANRSGKPGEVITPAALDERPRETLKVGDLAPDFTLSTASDQDKQVTLSSFRGKKPVVLVFGSISCPPFRRQLEDIDALYRKYQDKAEFLMVYIREAHPDSKILVAPEAGADEVLRLIPQTNDLNLRSEHARTCTNTFQLALPMLVDKPDNAVNAAYAGWPIRLAIVSTEGKIVYYGGPGPKGFHPEELAEWLQTNLK
jgi:thiol-disulfide isomerase/thioredoxin